MTLGVVVVVVIVVVIVVVVAVVVVCCEGDGCRVGGVGPAGVGLCRRLCPRHGHCVLGQLLAAGRLSAAGAVVLSTHAARTFKHRAAMRPTTPALARSLSARLSTARRL